MNRKTLIIAVVGIVLLVLAPMGQKNYIIYVLCSWLMFSIGAMGLNLTLGYAGQVSLAQASFMGIGAYVTALLTLNGWHWMAAMPLAVLTTFVIGLLHGLSKHFDEPITIEHVADDAHPLPCKRMLVQIGRA